MNITFLYIYIHSYIDSLEDSLVNVKDVQVGLQKTITWIKKSGKRKQEWERACMDSGQQLRKLKTHVKTRFANMTIMFEKNCNSKQQFCYVMVGKKTLNLQ